MGFCWGLSGVVLLVLYQMCVQLLKGENVEIMRDDFMRGRSRNLLLSLKKEN